MYTSAIAFLTAALATTIAANPVPATLEERSAATDSGPKINVIFFSDNNCTTTIPSTIYTRNVYGSHGCYNDAGNSKRGPYSSVIIDHIDDQFIGTNSALQVGYAKSKACGFTASEKFSISNRDNVGKCLFIGVTSSRPGAPLRPGNEYRLTTLEG